ncbi:MAG: hypothetical protein QG660_186 [Pseudomonadota bacterium]|jgi:hypothetical protein|nr:hypothetical protein [Pseudomonadota bacterium]MDQ5917077.1 hypothetical protein [Pseudomonadota bacterium]MDQ5941827.1 hypothetical protein [Pseudomonadota bacterium]
MRRNRSALLLVAAATVGLQLLVSGCSTTPPQQKAEAAPQAEPVKQANVTQLEHVIQRVERASIDLGDGLTFDYTIERKNSSVNAKACFAFITGAIRNDSSRTLDRRSVLDVVIVQRDKRYFRDLVNPVKDIQPGSTGLVQLITSPIHRNGCPAYDLVRVSLRKVT